MEAGLQDLPLAEFRSRAPAHVDPRAVQFANQTKGQVDSYRWDFGDGETSAEKEPLHRYDRPGTYTVTLEAVGPGGRHRRRKVDYVVLRR